MKSTKSRSWTSALLGLDPLPAPPWVASVDRDRLVLARVEHGDDGTPQVDDLRLAELPAETFQNGPLGGPARNPAELGERIRALLGPSPPSALSLVLPDEWLRLTFAESAELPRQPQAREDVLGWKLKRLVPYRLEELRFAGVEVPSIAGQSEPLRLLLAFAAESVVAQLEGAFAACGSRVGRVRSRTLGFLSAVADELAEAEIGLALRVEARAWSLVATHRGEPVLIRVRPFPSEADPVAALVRELRLTRAWLGQSLPRHEPSRLLLVCDPAERDGWSRICHDGLGLEPTLRQVRLAPGLPDLGQPELVPLSGAALEVIP